MNAFIRFSIRKLIEWCKVQRFHNKKKFKIGCLHLTHKSLVPFLQIFFPLKNPESSGSFFKYHQIYSTLKTIPLSLFFLNENLTMKFGKCLGQTIEDIPSDLRPFTIQYKKLKRCIHKIIQELDYKGISQDVRKAMLDTVEGNKMEYFFEGNKNIIYWF